MWRPRPEYGCRVLAIAAATGVFAPPFRGLFVRCHEELCSGYLGSESPDKGALLRTAARVHAIPVRQTGCDGLAGWPRPVVPVWDSANALPAPRLAGRLDGKRRRTHASGDGWVVFRTIRLSDRWGPRRGPKDAIPAAAQSTHYACTAAFGNCWRSAWVRCRSIARSFNLKSTATPLAAMSALDRGAAGPESHARITGTSQASQGAGVAAMPPVHGGATNTGLTSFRAAEPLHATGTGNPRKPREGRPA